MFIAIYQLNKLLPLNGSAGGVDLNVGIALYASSPQPGALPFYTSRLRGLPLDAALPAFCEDRTIGFGGGEITLRTCPLVSDDPPQPLFAILQSRVPITYMHLLSLGGLTVGVALSFMLSVAWAWRGRQISFERRIAIQRAADADELEQLVDGLNSMVAVLDNRGVVRYWNRDAEEVSGLPQRYAIGRTLDAIDLPVKSRTRLKHIINNALHGIESRSIHVTLHPDGGNQRNLLLAITPRRDRAGRTVGVIISGQDITRIVDAEGRLEEVDLAYARLLDELPLCVWDEDWSRLKTELNTLKLNNYAELEHHFARYPDERTRLMGLIRINRVNQGVLDLYEAPDAAALDAHIEKAPAMLFHGFKRVLDQLLRAAPPVAHSGKELTLTGKPIYTRSITYLTGLQSDTWQNVITIETDITDLRNEKDHADSLATELETLLDTTQAMIFCTDADGLISRWNHTAEELTGFPAEVAIGTPVQELCRQCNDDPRMLEAFTRALAGEGSMQLELPLPTHVGDSAMLLMNIAPRSSNGGRCDGIVVVAQDITALKESQLQAIHASRLATLGLGRPRDQPAVERHPAGRRECAPVARSG